jgi:hypothetical protein
MVMKRIFSEIWTPVVQAEVTDVTYQAISGPHKAKKRNIMTFPGIEHCSSNPIATERKNQRFLSIPLLLNDCLVWAGKTVLILIRKIYYSTALHNQVY